MPLFKQPGVEDYLRHSLILEPQHSTLAYAEVMLTKKILDPQESLDSRWENEDSVFNGAQIKTLHGDYLIIQKIPKES